MATTERRRNLYVSLIVLALMVGFLFWALDFDPRGRMMPVLVAWIGIVLATLDVIAHTDNKVGRWLALVLSGTFEEMRRTEDPAVRSARFRREVAACLWMLAAVALVFVVGFLPAIPVYIFAYMLIYGKRSVRQSGITALVTVFFVWLVFEIFLQYEIYRGILFSDY